MSGTLQEFSHEVKQENYPRVSGALVCDCGAVRNRLPKKQARGDEIRPPRLILRWDHRAFVRRVHDRVAQLNASDEGLAKAAGGRGDEIRSAILRAKLGPTATTLLFIATALRWTVGQVMGITDPSLYLERERHIDPHKLGIALYIADRAAEEVSPQIDRWTLRYANMVSAAYSLISDRETMGRTVDPSDSAFIDDVASLLRHL